MSVMIVSTVRKFTAIVAKLKSSGVTNIHFFNTNIRQGLNCPVMSLLPFVDLLIFDSHAFGSPRLESLRQGATQMNVPFIDDKTLVKGKLPKFTTAGSGTY